MMTVLMLIISTMIVTLLSPSANSWAKGIFWTSLMMLSSVLLISPLSQLSEVAWGLAKDTISTPLMYLSAWLMPVSILASAGHLSSSKDSDRKVFITLTLVMLFFLVMTFTSKKLIALFLGFEGTLIPTLFLMTRWGAQRERVEAGVFFVFYTLISSLPLFLGLLYLHKKNHSLSIFTLKVSFLGPLETTVALCCMVAFLVKVPVFALHLWLPKAHVEAPVAGSMMLAAILLKMGGYGFVRLSGLFFMPFKTAMSSTLVPFCVWGGMLTSVICLTQTDLKSLMAYSSVSHMSFMMAGISTLSSWAIVGGIVVMMAHGMVSSALFCMANTFYERSSTRNLLMNRGTKMIFALTPSLWLVLACAKMGLPPLPKAVGEVMVMSSIMAKKLFNYIPTLIGVMSTGIFSLLMFLAIKSGNFQKWSVVAGPMTEREHKVLAAHLMPLLALILTPKLMTPWLS